MLFDESYKSLTKLARKAQIISGNFHSQLRAGNQAAFRQLVEMYQQKVFNTAISMIQNHAEAEDITQEVFVSVYRSAGSFNEQSSLSTWIYRITVNKCLDHLRQRKRQKRQGVFGFIFQKDSAGELPDQATFDHPGVLLEQKEKARYLFQAIEKLPDNQKTAFVLAFIEDLPQKEIADVMNISVKAVESLLQRAKANLRDNLGFIYDRRKTE